MIFTFEDQCRQFQRKSKDYSDAGLEIAKDDINEGGTIFLNRLGRKFNREYRKTSLVASRQYYQFAADVLRISSIKVLNGTQWYTPELVASEDQWDRLNQVTQTGAFPTHYFIRGFNEVGLFPSSSATVANALEIAFEPQHVELTEYDFTTGSVTVSSGSPNGTTITHSASGFSQSMIGRWFQVTDGTDGKWYRISAFVSSSVLTLENYYEGIAGSGRTFRIGEVMKLPQGYHSAPVDYALQQFFDGEQDDKSSDRYEARFNRKVHSAKETYGRSTSKMGVRTGRGGRRRYNPARDFIYQTPSVDYP
jgi:hypothetical protein